MSVIIPPTVRAIVPRLGELFDTWAIREDELNGLLRYFEATGVASHVETARAKHQSDAEFDFDEPYVLDGAGVAVIPIVGTITKSGSSLSGFPGTTRTRDSIRDFANSPTVSAIVLHIDSPGGAAKGVDDLARDIAAAAEKKPIVAYADDLCASAAFYIAASATVIVANPSAVVGSIGVYTTVLDSSAAAQSEGVRVHVIKSVEFKAIGVAGAPVSDSQLADQQRSVMDQHRLFVDSVAAGRGVSRSKVEGWATGQIWIGEDARRLGLVDRIGSFDDALRIASELAESGPFTSKPRAEGGLPMALDIVPDNGTGNSEHEGDVMPGTDVERATIVALKRAIPNSDAEFREECVIQGRTVSEAKDDWIKRLESRAKASTGIEPIETHGKGSDWSGNATAAWRAAVAENKAAGMAPFNAVRKADRDNPGLRLAMLEETNA